MQNNIDRLVFTTPEYSYNMVFPSKIRRGSLLSPVQKNFWLFSKKKQTTWVSKAFKDFWHRSVRFSQGQYYLIKRRSLYFGKKNVGDWRVVRRPTLRKLRRIRRFQFRHNFWLAGGIPPRRYLKKQVKRYKKLVGRGVRTFSLKDYFWNNDDEYHLPDLLANSPLMQDVEEWDGEAGFNRASLIKFLTRTLYVSHHLSPLTSSYCYRDMTVRQIMNRLYRTKIVQRRRTVAPLRLRFRWKRAKTGSARIRKKRKHLLRRKFMYFRYMRFVWKFRRTYQFQKFMRHYGKKHRHARVSILKNTFTNRLDTFLVRRFGVKTRRYAKILLLLGHVYINGKPVADAGYIVKPLDFVKLTKRSLRWIRFLMKRRAYRLRGRAYTSRRFWGGFVQGPGSRYCIMWDPVRSLMKFGTYRRQKNVKLLGKKHLRFLLTVFAN